ncbi:type II toxin-antitoxin system VapC family toxin [bacterium]|nr:type II toxin-antitoxin system VapC family toxin [bacterium]
MSIAIDTNIFIYAQVSFYSQHKKVNSYLEALLNSGNIFYISWQIFYEYCQVMTYPGSYIKPMSIQEALSAFNFYLTHPSCHLLKETTEHTSVFESLIQELPSSKGVFIHDLHYATLLKENGINTVVSCDTDFKKFDFLKVINPAL